MTKRDRNKDRRTQSDRKEPKVTFTMEDVKKFEGKSLGSQFMPSQSQNDTVVGRKSGMEINPRYQKEDARDFFDQMNNDDDTETSTITGEDTMDETTDGEDDDDEEDKLSVSLKHRSPLQSPRRTRRKIPRKIDKFVAPKSLTQQSQVLNSPLTSSTVSETNTPVKMTSSTVSETNTPVKRNEMRSYQNASIGDDSPFTRSEITSQKSVPSKKQASPLSANTRMTSDKASSEEIDSLLSSIHTTESHEKKNDTITSSEGSSLKSHSKERSNRTLGTESSLSESDNSSKVESSFNGSPFTKSSEHSSNFRTPQKKQELSELSPAPLSPDTHSLRDTISEITEDQANPKLSQSLIAKFGEPIDESEVESIQIPKPMRQFPPDKFPSPDLKTDQKTSEKDSLSKESSGKSSQSSLFPRFASEIESATTQKNSVDNLDGSQSRKRKRDEESEESSMFPDMESLPLTNRTPISTSEPVKKRIKLDSNQKDTFIPATPKLLIQKDASEIIDISNIESTPSQKNIDVISRKTTPSSHKSESESPDSIIDDNLTILVGHTRKPIEKISETKSQQEEPEVPDLIAQTKEHLILQNREPVYNIDSEAFQDEDDTTYNADHVNLEIGSVVEESQPKRSKRKKIRPLRFWQNEEVDLRANAIVCPIISKKERKERNQYDGIRERNGKYFISNPVTGDEENTYVASSKKMIEQRMRHFEYELDENAVIEDHDLRYREGDGKVSVSVAFNQGNQSLSGVLILHQFSVKPRVNSGQYEQTFFVLRGRCVVIIGERSEPFEDNSFIAETGSLFKIPPNNYFVLENVNQVECKLGYSLCSYSIPQNHEKPNVSIEYSNGERLKT